MSPRAIVQARSPRWRIRIARTYVWLAAPFVDDVEALAQRAASWAFRGVDLC